ncbi:substrate-binding periplasmic protein [Litoribrevibacter albus]|uniref:ABC transporter substrate-binding protein n=1 Tax=Litoribrevibacter albus TaxID=1473156 RepID=A0AA37W5Y4_9GAMM|nr:ABC transporter substrate-binding protein [Litoribrevibacter albus]GLQ31557.1 ABC transporter substrate-binding protein [Litoribrevibacter albus]
MKTLIAVLCVLISLGVQAQTQVSIYGDDAYPPYSFKDKGKMTGIYTVVLQEIFQQMPEYRVSIEGYPWKRGLKEIEQGKIFALYPPYKRVKERPYMEYEEPILDEQLVVFCHEKVLSTPRTKWPDDYYGLTIGNNSGFAAGGDAFWQAVKRGDIKVEETKGTSKNLLKLIAGRIDCYMNDGLSIQWELKALQNQGKYNGLSVKKGAVISSEQGFLGFATDGSKFPYKDTFKEKFHAVLNQMKSSGRVQQVIDEFIAQ